MVTGAVQARREIEAPVHALVAERVLPAMGLAGRDLALTIPELGLSSLVFLVDVEGSAGFVVRVAHHKKGRRDLLRRIRAGRFWAQRGLPTPRVLHADLSDATRRRSGFWLLCEERIRGRNLVGPTCEPADFAAVGRALARVHAVSRRWHHGSFYQPRVGPFGYRLVKRHDEWTRRLAQLGVVEAELTGAHRAWLDRFPELHRGGPFQLIHRRCTESDVMVDEAGQGWVLEPQRCGFGCFLTDLVRAEERICRRLPERVAGLHEGYFGAVAPERRAQYDALAPVFRADLHLSNALRGARKLASGHGEAEPEFKRELDRFRKLHGV